MEYPELKSKVGGQGRSDDQAGGKSHFTITDEIRHTRHDLPSQIYCLQRIKFEGDGYEEFRLGYYIIGKKESVKGKWVWGQYCPMIPKEDFEAIIIEAKNKGWIGAC